MSISNNDGWNEYSRLVLGQLEALSTGIEGLREEVQGVKKDLAIIQAKEDKVTDLKAWKERFDDVASPTQMQNYLKQVDELILFRTKAVTIFAIVQFAMALAIAMIKLG